MLSAYFDEAGTDASKPAVAVGCYIATTDQWKAFNEDWRWLRDEVGVKEYFRRADQESFWRHDETKHWNRDQQICIYQAQHAFIQAYSLKGFAGAVIKTDYDDVITGVDRTALGNPYEFCLRHCLAGIANWLAAERPDDRISYFIESGAEGAGHLKAAFTLFLNDPELRKANRLEDPHSWSFVGKKDAVPLQAADALAYEAAMELEHTHGPVVRPTRRSFLDWYRPQVDDVRWVPKQKLIEMRDSVHADAERIWNSDHSRSKGTISMLRGRTIGSRLV